MKQSERYSENEAEQAIRCAFDNAMHLIGRLSNPSQALARLVDTETGKTSC
jgi:hypothetical protein